MRKLFLLATVSLLPGMSLAQYTFSSLLPTVAHDQSFGLAIDGTGQAGYCVDTSFVSRASIWQNTGASLVDLHPSGFFLSQATGCSGTSQVGFGMDSSFSIRALLWSGTAASAVDLTPAGALSAFCTGVSGSEQVGFADFGSGSRAIVWNGTAASFQDITPSGASAATVLCTSGGTQGGWSNITGDNHATIWSGSAVSASDIHPAAYTVSQVSATDGNTHGGFAILGGVERAAFWGTSGFVDLHPAGYQQSAVRGVSSTKQAGYGLDAGGVSHALVWSGTAASVVDLNQFLPIGYTGAQALGMDDNGNIVGVAFGGTSSGQAEAVVWNPVLLYQFIGFLNPINDPAVPESVFKRNATVPLKFKLKDSNGVNVPDVVAIVSLVKLGAVESPVNEELFTGPCDPGVTFDYNSYTQTYHFNMRTSHLQAKKRYRVTATLSNGQTHSVTFSLK
ncbi:MAG: PxKF domain-containing protein [Fimbriimonadaceae bacterium]